MWNFDARNALRMDLKRMGICNTLMGLKGMELNVSGIEFASACKDDQGGGLERVECFKI